MDKLSTVLARIDSRHLSKLWIFYRDYFQSDEECLDFIFDVLHNEPLPTSLQLNEDERLFIPRRMMNCVERMVSTAKDMELIRRGKDIFKIVLLVSCVETLQTLCGNTKMNKWKMFFDFWENYTSDENKEYIRNNFSYEDFRNESDYADDEETSDNLTEDPFKQFINVLNEYRNCASHEGEYWDICFKQENTEIPMQLEATVWVANGKQKRTFSTNITYREFERIFVFTCITFMEKYVHDHEVR